MSFCAFSGFQGWNSWMPEVSETSAPSRSATAALLPGWLLASSLGGLVSILVSRLELPPASPLRGAALSESVLSGESCAREAVVVTSANRTIRNRLRTTLLYRFRARPKLPDERERQRKAYQQFPSAEIAWIKQAKVRSATGRKIVSIRMFQEHLLTPIGPRSTRMPFR